MNKSTIRDLIKRAEELSDEIQSMSDDEQADWDERSERWQDSDRGQDAQQAIDQLAEVADSISDAVSTLEELL